jgi:serine/threonine protein kinase
LGQGSFGQVYLVKRKSDGRKLVMKKMNIGNVTEKEMDAFNLEVKLLSELVTARGSIK